MNWKAFYNFAMAHYNEGGDSVVECWDEDTFNDWIAEGHQPTEEEAMRFFRLFDSVRCDMIGW